MPPLHPIIVHFPIALFVISILFDSISIYTRRDTYVAASRLLLILSWIGTGAALLTGDWLKDSRGAFLPHRLLSIHETLAIVFAAWLTVLVVVRLRKSRRPTLGHLGLSGVGFFLLLAVGHTGGAMAWPALTEVGVSQSKLPHNQVAVGTPTGNAPSSASPSANQTGQTGSTNPLPTTTKGSNSSSPSRSSTPPKTQTPPVSTMPPKQTTPSPTQVLYTDGAHFFEQQCQSCHSLSVSEQYYGQLSASQWDEVVTKMQSYAGGSISDSHVHAIEYYLVHHHS